MNFLKTNEPKREAKSEFSPTIIIKYFRRPQAMSKIHTVSKNGRCLRYRVVGRPEQNKQRKNDKGRTKYGYELHRLDKYNSLESLI